MCQLRYSTQRTNASSELSSITFQGQWFILQYIDIL